MQSDDDMRKLRAQARASWPVRRLKLQDEEAPDLSALTPGERIALVWRLTQDAWAFKGEPLPSYQRHDAPGRVIRARERS
jgi:dolichyl-phosphate-mannose--protein O-mannosyl transferase